MPIHNAFFRWMCSARGSKTTQNNATVTCARARFTMRSRRMYKFVRVIDENDRHVDFYFTANGLLFYFINMVWKWDPMVDYRSRRTNNFSGSYGFTYVPDPQLQTMASFSLSLFRLGTEFLGWLAVDCFGVFRCCSSGDLRLITFYICRFRPSHNVCEIYFAIYFGLIVFG